MTLTAANHVVHLSRWRNPAVEDQCTDRIFRIGQERPYHVWYPMALHPAFPGGSFDEALNALLERKRALTRRLLVPPVGPSDEAELLKATLGQRAASPQPAPAQSPPEVTGAAAAVRA